MSWARSSTCRGDSPNTRVAATSSTGTAAAALVICVTATNLLPAGRWSLVVARGTVGRMNPCLSQGCDEQVFESPSDTALPHDAQVGVTHDAGSRLVHGSSRPTRLQPVRSWTTAIARPQTRRRIRRTRSRFGAIDDEAPDELGEQDVPADVQVPRTIRAPRTGAAVAVTAAVPGPAVHPVRIHPPPAQATHEQTREQVPTERTVAVHPSGPNLLDGEEVHLAHQRRMRRRPRDHCLRRYLSAALRRAARIGGDATPPGRCSADWPRSPPPTADSTPGHYGADSVPGPHRTARSTRGRSPPRCALQDARRTSTARAARSPDPDPDPAAAAGAPHAACARFRCGPASTRRYLYGGRPPRNWPCSTVGTVIAANVRCRARTTSRCDCAASTFINTRCAGSSTSTGPAASGSHTVTHADAAGQRPAGTDLGERPLELPQPPRHQTSDQQPSPAPAAPPPAAAASTTRAAYNRHRRTPP